MLTIKMESWLYEINNENKAFIDLLDQLHESQLSFKHPTLEFYNFSRHNYISALQSLPSTK